MTSSSSSSLSAPALSSRSWKQHVFLSFRGEDTRNNFVGHLYTTLVRMGIHTYKDDKKLSLGEEINPSLVDAIEQSQIAIIVFSENYADSSWCLNELTHIMKCSKKRGLIVVPIFYGVEPSEVRKQKLKYGEAFDKYELENNTNVESWKEALVEASGNSGQDFKSGNMDESKLIEKIVNKISKMIRPLTPRVNDKLVGIEARMDALISKLQIGSDSVLMVGIWGLGGGGKTTLATSVYRRISWEFDGCCYIENIREQSKNGLAKLQEKIISSVLKQKEVQVWSVEEGKDMIMDSFSCKKVLIVLDDVDQLDQLKALAGSIDWFAKGSRIIITTRNKQLLNAHDVDVHDISLLDNREATRLLSKCVGLGDKPMKDYESLLEQVVLYASGLPLALTVLGSFLCKRDVKQWQSTLDRLKKIPDGDIVGKLRISYDGLKKAEQDMFLDIACFFRGHKKDSAMRIFDACGLYPDIGLEVLREKALITISDDEKFDMHDLVQEMGHNIVRGEHPDNPEKHSRIWKAEDVLTICSMCDATSDLDTIEAVQSFQTYNVLVRANPLQHLHPIVANTKNLRWIYWNGDLADSLLTNFPQRKLCCLMWNYSLQTRLWEGYKLLPNLKIMELWHLKNLIVTPDFAGLRNLERFILVQAYDLEEIHPSFGDLEKLVFLSIERCPQIKKFPSINRLQNLKDLSFRWSPGLFQLSEIQQQKMKRSPYPHLNNSGDSDTQVKKPGVDRTDVEECCLEEPSLPLGNMNHHTRLWFYRASLTTLVFGGCELTDEDIGSSEWELPLLQELDLSHNEFSRLDFSLWRLPKLRYLGVGYCKALVELSNLPPSIAYVDANNCSSLKWFGDTSNCKWLWKVRNCGGLKLDPFDGERLLNFMLQGNAIEDHFIYLILEHQIPKGFVGRFFKGKTITLRDPEFRETLILHLPDDWYNEFGGFLVRVVTRDEYMYMNIVIKQNDPDEEDCGFEIWQESDEAPEPEYDGEVRTFVGYVSFSSLKQTTPLNSSYNIISFYMKKHRWSSFSVELVPMKSKDDVVQTTKVPTNCSEFWNNKDRYLHSFNIQDDSKSNINILLKT